MIKLHNILFFALLYCATINSNTPTYNSLGQTGLINIPSAEVNDEQLDSLGGLLKVAQQPTELRRAQENLGWRMNAGRGLGVVLLQE